MPDESLTLTWVRSNVSESLNKYRSWFLSRGNAMTKDTTSLQQSGGRNYSPMIVKTDVPQFTIPQKQRKDEHYISEDEVQVGSRHDSTNSDPYAAAALSLPHFKSQTVSGFETLSQAPHTRRKESLFHDGGLSLLPLPSKPIGVESQVNIGSTSLNVDISTGRNRKFSRSSSKRRQFDTLPVVSPLIPDNSGLAVKRCASNGSDPFAMTFETCLFEMRPESSPDKEQYFCPSTFLSVTKDITFMDPKRPRPIVNRLFSETIEHGSVAVSIKYTKEESTLTVQLIRAKNLTLRKGRAGPINSYVKGSLMPGKIQTRISGVLKNTSDPFYSEDFVFRDVAFEALRDMTVRFKFYNRCRLACRDEAIGVVELPLGLVDLQHGGRLWKNLEPVNKEKPPSPPLDRQTRRLHYHYLPEVFNVYFALSDPYVKVELKQQTSKKARQKTTALKKTSNPTYDKTFTFAVSPRIQDIKYTGLNFTIYSKNLILCDGVIGQVKLGFGSTEESELQHWKLVVQNPGQTFTEVHKIMDFD
ncbi:C2 calcium-dependent domain-containing protein 4C-like [Lineus longissimus]|uniref:C2 calcium-dependent domain-containing protein 4C-like n=1 Tax=Lineus longissimus TaxID=88925 RepID=UPI00315C5D91